MSRKPGSTCQAWAFAALALLATHGATASETQLPALGSVEVLVQVPPDNFVYSHGSLLVHGNGKTSGTSTPPLVMSPGVGALATLGINLLGALVYSGIERAAALEAFRELGPLAQSVQDLDLRATTLAQLRALQPPSGPQWVLSGDAFPEPGPEPPRNDPAVRHLAKRPVAQTLQHLFDRAKASSSDATLFIDVLPLYRGRAQGAVVNITATLIAQSGLRLAQWKTVVLGPAASGPDAVSTMHWWADRRYRQFVIQAIRGGLIPLVEDIHDPGTRAERQRQWAAFNAQRFDESGRPVDATLGHRMNVGRMLSAACILLPDQRAVTYHYARSYIDEQVVAALSCPGDAAPAWSLETPPGAAWSHLVEAPPAVAQRRIDESTQATGP